MTIPRSIFGLTSDEAKDTEKEGGRRENERVVIELNKRATNLTCELTAGKRPTQIDVHALVQSGSLQLRAIISRIDLDHRKRID